MDAITPIARHLFTRALPTCPGAPKSFPRGFQDPAVIMAELKQPIVDAIATCHNDTKTDFSLFYEQLSDNEVHPCWVIAFVTASCAKSQSWKCIQNKMKTDSLDGNAFCYDKGTQAAQKGGAESLRISKWAVVGLIVGIAVMSGGTL